MLERRYGGAEQQCTRYPWQSREILGGREPTNAGQGGGTATGYDFWGRAVGAPTMRLRLVDEARGLPNHDGMRSFLSEDGQHDAATMIAKYAATKPLVVGCRVWRTGGTREASHGPLGPTYRKFGRAELIGHTRDSKDAIVSTTHTAAPSGWRSLLPYYQELLWRPSRCAAGQFQPR